MNGSERQRVMADFLNKKIGEMKRKLKNKRWCNEYWTLGLDGVDVWIIRMWMDRIMKFQ